MDVDRLASEAFSIAEDHGVLASAPHAHSKHQLLYAASGTLQLVASGRRWMLPPQRAAWIAAGVRHEVSSATGVSLRTAYFAPSFVPSHDTSACRVFAVPALGREMIAYTARWDARAQPSAPGAPGDRVREPFFRALAALVLEWMTVPARYHLPEPTTKGLARATDYVRANLEEATPEGAAKVAGMSLRTLTRRFETELDQSFRDYRSAARMLRAMELLALPEGSVTTAGLEVGFRSLPAFSTAFKDFAGETPSEYRARIVSAG